MGAAGTTWGTVAIGAAGAGMPRAPLVPSRHYLPAMLHIAFHFVVPALVAAAIDRDRWLSIWLVLVAAMLVDVDHLLADPVYDPDRCSIGFHPLHTTPAIVAYAAMFVGPVLARRMDALREDGAVRLVTLVGLGLLLHMALDGIDCLV